MDVEVPIHPKQHTKKTVAAKARVTDLKMGGSGMLGSVEVRRVLVCSTQHAHQETAGLVHLQLARGLHTIMRSFSCNATQVNAEPYHEQLAVWAWGHPDQPSAVTSPADSSYTFALLSRPMC
jgi:hypothetical protein